jgi:hypothetical protein
MEVLLGSRRRVSKLLDSFFVCLMSATEWPLVSFCDSTLYQSDIPFSSCYEYHPPNNFYIIHPVPIRPYAWFHTRSFFRWRMCSSNSYPAQDLTCRSKVFIISFPLFSSFVHHVQIIRIRYPEQLFIVALTDVLTDIPLYDFCSTITQIGRELWWFGTLGYGERAGSL